MKSNARRDLPAFRPHPLLYGGNRQTILGAYLQAERPSRKAIWRHIPVSHGDQVIGHDEAPPTWRPGDRICALFHGLSGSHGSPYVVRTARKLRERGLRTLCVDMRGFGESVSCANLPGHAGRSEDAASVVEYLYDEYPKSPVTLLGYSMGANVTLKLAGEVGRGRLGGLDSCFAVCPPIHLKRCCLNMRRRSRRIYTRRLVKNLLRLIHQKQKTTPGFQGLVSGPKPRFIDEFDSLYTAPRSGFRDVDDYYDQASSLHVLGEIRMPTMIIAAADDPLIPVEIFDDTPHSNDVALHIMDSGGHLGFVGRPGIDPDRRWLDWRAVDWILEQGVRRQRGQKAALPPIVEST